MIFYSVYIMLIIDKQFNTRFLKIIKNIDKHNVIDSRNMWNCENLWFSVSLLLENTGSCIKPIILYSPKTAIRVSGIRVCVYCIHKKTCFNFQCFPIFLRSTWVCKDCYMKNNWMNDFLFLLNIYFENENRETLKVKTCFL